MSDVLAALQSDLENPAAQKSGEFLEEHVLNTIRRALSAGDRAGVVLALREWIALRKEPETMLAVSAVRKERIRELRDELLALRIEIQAGRIFKTFYLEWLDDALAALKTL